MALVDQGLDELHTRTQGARSNTEPTVACTNDERTRSHERVCRYCSGRGTGSCPEAILAVAWSASPRETRLTPAYSSGCYADDRPTDRTGSTEDSSARALLRQKTSHARSRRTNTYRHGFVANVTFGIHSRSFLVNVLGIGGCSRGPTQRSIGEWEWIGEWIGE